MADDWIMITFRKLHFKRNLISAVSAGDLYFKASIDGTQLGDPNQLYVALPNGIVTPIGMSVAVNVAKKDKIAVKFQVMDKRFFVGDDDLGSLTYTLKFPFGQKEYTVDNQYWILEWGVEVGVNIVSAKNPSEIWACRSGAGFLTLNTVGGTAIMTRMEINGVRPVPPVASLPLRPVFPTGAAAAKLNRKGVGNLTADDPINIIPNPAVIPILSDANATATTAARIEFTYYKPETLAFADDDARLTWTASSISGGGAVKFVGQPKGLKVLVYGTAAGEVLLQVTFQGQIFASYRVLVGAVKTIPCRFNICNGPDSGSQPRATPENVRDHLAIANRFLRQMAVQLTLDTDTSVTDGAVASAIPGIFRIRVPAGDTKGVANAGYLRAVAFNYRSGIMNFAYIHSTAPPDPTHPELSILGAASDYPASKAGTTITDSGTPSSSWKSPSGVKPDGAAAAVTMTLLAKRQRATPAGVVGMFICDGCGDPANADAQQTYAGTIAHEFGHNLNLAHRVENPNNLSYDDTVSYPPDENVMHWLNPTSIAQDFDIIQAKAARQSPLIP